MMLFPPCLFSTSRKSAQYLDVEKCATPHCDCDEDRTDHTLAHPAWLVQPRSRLANRIELVVADRDMLDI